MNINDEIMQLIIKHLSQTSSGADDLELQKWIDGSPENQVEFDKLRKVWEASGTVVAQPIDVEMEWAQFKNKHFANPEIETKVIPLWTRLMPYAAAAAVLIGLFLGFQFFNQSEVYSTGDGQRLLVNLEDGTEIILGENSSLTVSNAFNTDKREVELKGEGFFTVAKNPAKPFEITGPKTTTRILGTAFQLVANDEKNYLNVSEGKVAYWETDNRDTLILTRGEHGAITNGKLTESTIDDPNFDSWKTGVFTFEDKQVAEVLRELQNYYLFNAPNLNQYKELPCRFSGKFKDQTLNSALEEFALIMGMEYTLEDSKLTIEGFNCN